MNKHMEEEKKYPLKQSAAFAGGTLLASLPFEIFGHFGPTGLLVGGLASYVAWKHGPEIYEYVNGQVRGILPPSPAPFESPDEPEEAQSLTSKRSLLERALGIYPDQKGQPKEAREEDEATRTAPSDTSERQTDGTWVPSQFKMDDVLEIIHDFNARGSVYFGESEAGAVAIPLSDMYHVIDVSSSGKGKSNRFRLAMMQMVTTCQTYYINPLAANVKAVKDERTIEVWKPIYERLANKRPVKEGDEILTLMTQLTNEIKHRNSLEEEGDFTFMDHPIFVFIDELPEVFERCPDAIKLLDKIGRAGRQFGVFCWIASQTALVSEIGQSTAAQANYKTRIYGGGDKTSCNRLMKGSIPNDAERTLQKSGAGLTLMLADGMESLAFVRAPLVTNEALFDYLGLPPFRKEDWLKRKTSGGSPSTSNIRQLRPAPERIDDENEDRYARPVTGNEHSPFELDEEENTPLRDARNEMDQSASEEAVRAQNDAVNLPAGWDQKKVEMLPGFYRVLGLDKALIALELSTSQRNRDFAREVLKQQGLWKEAK